ncbi:NAD(P)/FAD-dependent oxidoreductase [Nocardia iowensis]|uniref:NAD(P)/FAD-dependent oxidoreductase n=1 Tax=Nocardia iowensis TaxID=204891 RepID=A0ABX8S036_NOCIO|nr:NAD(P)/FAD-dependent oxidoreductase [Nocardia iowensis]QXN94459.1 NAD(P)/FAD-dependent oxidoreductase [Nocardia iowensis]
MYDVIVVGARCAGSPLAMLLARRGHRVLVVDRNAFPSDTLSTHYIHQPGIARLRDWGLLDKLIASGVPPVRRMNASPTLRGLAEIEGVTETYAPRRTVLDALLVDAARAAGAEVIERFTVTDLIWDDGRVVGVRGSSADTGEQEFRASFVVGADGRNSTVSKLVDAEYNRVIPALSFASYTYYDGLDWEPQLRFGSDPQVFGSWPTNDGRVLVAVMRLLDRYSEFRADVAGNFQQVVDQVLPEYGAQLRDAERAEPFRTLRYPDNYYRRSAGPGWALVGDAGYHKDPVTGWGISDALVYGELLADKLHAGLSGAQPIDKAVREYERLRDERTTDTFDFTCTRAEMKPPSPLEQAVVEAAGGSELGRNRYFTMVGGGMKSSEFFARDNLQALYEAAGTPAADRLFPTESC